MNIPTLFAAAQRHHQAGRLGDAEMTYREVLKADPQHAPSHHFLGICAYQLGRLTEATSLILNALALDPCNAQFHGHLGVVFKAQNQVRDAIASYRSSLSYAPDNAEVHFNLGNALRADDQLDAAIASWLKALSLNPQLPQAHNNLSNALREKGDMPQASRHARLAIEMQPDFAEAHNNLGNALQEQGLLNDAQEHYRRALALRPDYLEALNNLGNVYQRQGQHQHAATIYNQALANNPNVPELHGNLATALFALGKMRDGWREYEWRWQTPTMRPLARTFEQPRWDGTISPGQTIFIHAEQGFGDTLHFCRYASYVAAMGMRVILEVQPSLVRLLRTLNGVALVIAQGDNIPPFDCHCPLLSVPLALNEDTPAILQEPYLFADRTAALQLRSLAKPGRMRVGLAWAGDPRSAIPSSRAIDQRRSIAPTALSPLMNVPGIDFFSLQKFGPQAPASFRLIDLMGEMADFADTATLIETLDLVITVDTSIVHLVGALGRPVWMLDRADHCWRWRPNENQSVWYPTLRIYRQSRWGDWSPVIQRVRSELAHFAQKEPS